MTVPERVILYALVLGLRPERALEIGTAEGGSALIITQAMDEVGHGTLICLDPNPRITPSNLVLLAGRTRFIQGPSPDFIPEASLIAGGKFDFVLVDGDHSEQAVRRDVLGLVPYLDEDAVLLFHDSHFSEVSKGIRSLALPPIRLVDCGLISTGRTPDMNGNIWGGFRMLRHQ